MQSEDTALIPLYRRDGTVCGHALVDVADAAWLGQWRWGMVYSGPTRAHLSALRYESLGDKRWRRIRMHRAIMGLSPAHDDDLEVDHINHDALDNRRSNLRVVTHAQNLQNRKRGYRQSSSERGVRLHNGGWVAEAKLDGHQRHIGRFPTEEEAIAAVRYWRATNMPFSPEAMEAANGHGPECPPERVRVPGTSQYRGVYWNASKKRWVGQIKRGGRRVDVGQFLTEAEAAEALDRWKAEHLPPV